MNKDKYNNSFKQINFQQSQNLSAYSSQNIKKKIIKSISISKERAKKRSKIGKIIDQISILWMKVKIFFELLWSQLVPNIVRGRDEGCLPWKRNGKQNKFGQQGSLQLIIEKYKHLKYPLYILFYNGSLYSQANQILPLPYLLLLSKKIIYIRDYNELKADQIQIDCKQNSKLLHICKINKFEQIVSFAEIQLEHNEQYIPIQDLRLLINGVQQQINNFSELQSNLFIDSNQL